MAKEQAKIKKSKKSLKPKAKKTLKKTTQKVVNKKKNNKKERKELYVVLFYAEWCLLQCKPEWEKMRHDHENNDHEVIDVEING